MVIQISNISFVDLFVYLFILVRVRMRWDVELKLEDCKHQLLNTCKCFFSLLKNGKNKKYYYEISAAVEASFLHSSV